MQIRALGQTGIKVSVIGYGTWGLGGDAYGPVDDDLAARCLHTALDRGVTFYDTADIYGNGRSEAALGRAFRDRRHEIVIATKGGMLPHTGFDMPQDFSLPHMQAAFSASLERLQTDHIDIYQFHSPTLAELNANGATLDWLADMKRVGRIRCCGISTRSPLEALEALGRFPFDVVQVNFNLIDQRATECGLFAACLEHGVGVIVRTPLCFGYLSGKRSSAKNFEGLDHRANWPDSQLHIWSAAPGLFTHLYAHDNRCTPSQFALGFCLTEQAVSVAIPGMKNVQQVIENTEAGIMPPLPPEAVAEAQRIYSSNIFYDKAAKSKAGA